MARSACGSPFAFGGVAVVQQFFPLVILIAFGVAGIAVHGQWAPAHATFYGGQDASGTMGGSCGYGNLYSTGYNTATAALSIAMFNDGLSCGSCFTIVCDSTQTSNCYPGKSITVTATNLCPQGSFGGWCDSPRSHFDLSYNMFTSMAPAGVGVVPVNYMRTPCQKSGGIRFTINGNPWFMLVLVTNVAGGGDVNALSVKGDSTGWFQMSHNWGVNYEGDYLTQLITQGLSFLVTLGGGASIVCSDVASAGWSYGQTFQALNNF